MKTISKSLLSAALILSMGAATAQTNLSFDKIRVAGSSTVELRQGPANSIAFEDEESTGLERFYSVSNDGWLNVTGKAGDDIIVTAPVITRIDLAGTGKLETDSVFKANEIDLRVSGVGKIEMNLESEKIITLISGAGKVELEGTTNILNIDISGAGKVDAEQMKAKEATINISGSGKSLVNVSDVLTSNISGSGSVYYVARPTTINTNVSGSGKVGDAAVVVKDTTKITMGKIKLLIVDEEGKNVKLEFEDAYNSYKSKLKAHWAGFELGYNLLMDDNFENKAPVGYEYLDQKWEKSIAVNFNLVDYEIDLYRKNIMLVTGLGFTINNYRFSSQSYLVPGVDSVVAYTDPSVNVTKNKLVAQYLTVPLLIEFNTSLNPKKTFHIALGMIGGVRIASHGKLITEKDGDEVKSKYYDQYNLNPWRYDATVRLGYRGFTVFGSYDMAGLFKDNKGPEVYPLTVGLRLVGW